MIMPAVADRPVVISEPENISIGELKYSSRILEIVEKIRTNFEKSSGSSLIFLCDGKDLGKDSMWIFYRGINFNILDDYLGKLSLEKSEEAAEEFPYRIYQAPKKYHNIMGAMLGVPCSNYHGLYLETPDGIVNRDFGEYFPNPE